MNENASNPNIEWKKSGFEASERVTLKTNVKKAAAHEAKDARNVQKAYVPTVDQLPVGLSKIRKKIREVFDEEDEEYMEGPLPMNPENSLLNALSDDEKKTLQVKDNLNQKVLVKGAEELAALKQVEKFAKESGLKQIDRKSVLGNINKNEILTMETIDRAIEKNLKKETGLKITKGFSKENSKELAKGIKKIRKVGGDESLKGMKLKEVIEVGKKSSSGKDSDERKAAELILEKSGRDKKSRQIAVKGLKLNKSDYKYINDKLAKERD